MTMLIPPQAEHTGAARVEMLGFSKRFGALQALDDVSMTVEAGSFHALLGENGAGKSTLVKLYRDNASTLTPDPLHSAWYDSHPSPAARIARLAGARSW